MSEQQNARPDGVTYPTSQEHPEHMGNYGIAPQAPSGAHQAGKAASWQPAAVQSYPVAQVPMREEIRELPYHRLVFSDAKHSWWKPLVVGALGGLVYLGVSIGFTLFLMLLLKIFHPEIISAIYSNPTAGDTEDALTGYAMSTPLVFLLLFGSVALMFPVLWASRLLLGPKPWGIIHSVMGRIRWGWLALCFGLALLFYAVVPTVLDLLMGSTYTFAPEAHGADLAWLIVLLIVLVPVQCYAEELVFRGYLMQTIGSWLKNPAWAIILPAPLFMLGHAYDLWGQLSVLCMGLAAGFLAWRTGGLESGIALHVANNLVAMGFGIFGLADPFLQEGSNLPSFLVSLATQLIFIGAVIWLAKRRGIERVRPVRFQIPAPELEPAFPAQVGGGAPSNPENLPVQKSNPENPEQ